MTRRQSFVVALVLAVALAAGVFALLRTVSLGASAAGPTDAQLAAQSAQLDRAEAALRREAAQRPPALPPSADAAAPSAQPQPVIYRRADPIVVAGRSGSDEHEEEQEHEGGEDD
ncbi:MAG: hypothetical protein ACM33B_16015 [Pseudomonadota bacterium]